MTRYADRYPSTGTPRPATGYPVAGTRVWLDSSSWTTVAVCELCPFQHGPYFDVASAATGAMEHHADQHPTESGWSLAEARALTPCSGHPDCTRRTIARGLCMAHYQSRRRAAQVTA